MFHSVASASESPIPALRISGSPQARYSPFFVGDDASLEKHGLINEIPASAADKYEGTSELATEWTLKFEPAIPRSRIKASTRSRSPIVSHSRCAVGRRLTTLAKKSAILSVRYHPSKDPL